MNPGFQHLRMASEGDVTVVTIDRPPLNAIDAVLHADLCRLATWLRDDPPGRAVVLTGAGDHFSAGGDFAWFSDLDDPAAVEELRRSGKQLIWDFLDVEIPVVAAVNGPAMGLAATLVLLCDAIFMATDATIGDPHVRVGIVAGDGGTAIWPLAVGPALAKRFLLTGDPLGAEEAHRIGLVTHVVPADRVREEAVAFAGRLAAGAPLAVRYTKLAVNKWVKEALNVAFDVATAYEVVTLRSADHREALAAWRERRPPRFEGR